MSILWGERVRAVALAAGLVLVGCGGKNTFRMGAAGATGAAGAMGAAGAAGAGNVDAAAPTDAAPEQVALSDAAACSPQTLERQAPDLLLLLDRSGSMTNQVDDSACPVGAFDAGACVRKWEEVTKAINQVVAETESSLHWGLKYFPNDVSCGIQPGVAVAAGAKSAASIAASIAVNAPMAGKTPTRVAVASAGEYLNGLHDGNPKVVLLATDGLPTCTPGAPSPSLQDVAGTVAAIKALADSGIPVYVIGIGTIAMGTMTLNEMAMAGGRPRAGDLAYYPVESSQTLVDALHAIGAQTGVCAYALPSVPTKPSDVVISTSGLVIPHDAAHAEGWDYDAMMNSIQLYGTWCAKDKTAALTTVVATERCP
jgi:Mg-chelatase subunit ChlD